jgi:hypothetical protein
MSGPYRECWHPARTSVKREPAFALRCKTPDQHAANINSA